MGITTFTAGRVGWWCGPSCALCRRFRHLPTRRVPYGANGLPPGSNPNCELLQVDEANTRRFKETKFNDTQKIIAFSLITIGAALALVAQQSATEAPAGFTTPTLGQTVSPTGEIAANPGSQSISNGIAEPPGDTFALDQAQFERRHDPSTGLGPVFNATSCVECHNNGVAGAAGQFTEQRFGHTDSNGNFVNPTITINGGAETITGRSIVNDRAICPQAQEHVATTETIQALRAVLNTLGDGFVEAVGDQAYLAIAAAQPGQSNGLFKARRFKCRFSKRPDRRQ
jgi:energy-converting hydrogenase Eha subunit C